MFLGVPSEHGTLVCTHLAFLYSNSLFVWSGATDRGGVTRRTKWESEIGESSPAGSGGGPSPTCVDREAIGGGGSVWPLHRRRYHYFILRVSQIPRTHLLLVANPFALPHSARTMQCLFRVCHMQCERGVCVCVCVCVVVGVVGRWRSEQANVMNSCLISDVCRSILSFC